MSPRDPGLQPERTSLAWQRTALGLFGAGLLVVRAAHLSAIMPALVLAIVASSGGVLSMLTAAARANARPKAPAPPWLIVSVAACTTVTAAVAAYVALLGLR